MLIDVLPIRYRLLDLFAGAGGMSNGFIQTGKFRVVVAVEKDIAAQNTYRKNHPDAVIKGDINQLDFDQLLGEFGEIDVIIGGPPCQGFSNANRQKSKIISTNNQLVKKYVDAVMSVAPKVFVLENVKMFKSETHRFFITHSERNLINRYSIKVKEEYIKIGKSEALAEYMSLENLSIKDYSSLLFNDNAFAILNKLFKNCKYENRLVLCKNNVKTKKCILELLARFQKNVNGVENIIYESLLRVQDYVNDVSSNIDTLRNNLYILIDMQKSILTLKELYQNDVDFKISIDRDNINIRIRSYSVLSYLVAILGTKYHLAKGILNAADFGVPQSRERYILIGKLKELDTTKDVALPKAIKTTSDYTTIRNALEDLEKEPTSFETSEDGIVREHALVPRTKYQRYVCNSNELYNNIITASTDVALRRFATLDPGQNFHNLSEALKRETYANLEHTQNTIYKRLDYDTVSGTVLNVRKSMWIHPVINRAVSIREAARLQSFQDSFVFSGTKDSQYQQVGNAVPPLLARAIAEKSLELLGDTPVQFLVDIL